MIYPALIGGFEWFTRGGWAMYPLLFLSVVSLWVILQRSIFFATRIPRINHEIDNILRGSSLLPGRTEGELAPLLAKSLGDGRLDEKSAELAAERELLEAARWLNTLETISLIAPLLGLTGTVTGMVRTFQQVADLQGAVNPSQLAGGIWEALLTTVFGLLVTIPALTAFRYFRGRLIRWENRMHSAIDDTMQVINSRGKAAPVIKGAREAAE